MSSIRKLLAILLIATLALALFACGSPATSPTSGTTGSGETTGTTGPVTYDQVVFAYATFNNIPAEEARKELEESINTITRAKIGAEITLMPISLFDYNSIIRDFFPNSFIIERDGTDQP